MVQGLQVWDGNGNVQLDTSTQTSSIVKILTLDALNVDVTYTNPILSTDKFFYVISPYGRWSNYRVRVTKSNSTITVRATSSTAVGATVVLGVY